MATEAWLIDLKRTGERDAVAEPTVVSNANAVACYCALEDSVNSYI